MFTTPQQAYEQALTNLQTAGRELKRIKAEHDNLIIENEAANNAFQNAKAAHLSLLEQAQRNRTESESLIVLHQANADAYQKIARNAEAGVTAALENDLERTSSIVAKTNATLTELEPIAQNLRQRLEKVQIALRENQQSTKIAEKTLEDAIATQENTKLKLSESTAKLKAATENVEKFVKLLEAVQKTLKKDKDDPSNGNDNRKNAADLFN